MTADQPVLLVDTNVWVDGFDGSRPASKDAMALFAYADAHHMTLAYPAASIKDVYYALALAMKRKCREEHGSLTEAQALICNEYAWACVNSMRDIAVAVPVGEPQVWLACHYKDLHGDFEDDLVLAALETSKADFLVTNDETLRKKAPAGAFSAADMLTYLQARDEAGL